MNSQSVVGAALLAAGALILAGLGAILFAGSDLGFFIAMQLGFAGVLGTFLLGLAGVIGGGLALAGIAPHHPRAHAPHATAPTGLRSAHCH